MKKHVLILSVLLVAVVLLLGLSGVVARAGGLVDTTFNFDDFERSPAFDNYCVNITNPYWTLPAPTTFVYYTMPKVGDGCEINYVWVRDLASPVMIEVLPTKYLPTQEVQDWVYADDDCDGQIDTDRGYQVLLENTLDWYAQDKFGNLWYIGEHTEEYSCTPPNQGCTSLEGTWSANIAAGSLPGIIMLDNPSNGEFYQQEYDADNAEDMAKVLRVNARVNLTFNEDNPNDINPGEYGDCLKTKEWSPLELGNVEHKYYCQTTIPGGDPIGLFLLGNELQGGTARTELVDYYLSDPGLEVPVPGFQFPTNP